MIQSAETRLDGTTLFVRIPMRFQRRGGRKRIVAPDGNELAPATKPRPDGTLVKALARAWRWQRMLDEGLCHRQRARRRREYLEELRKPDLRLALLAPDIVESILAGRTDQALMLKRLERPLPASWDEQRDHLGCPATVEHRLRQLLHRGPALLLEAQRLELRDVGVGTGAAVGAGVGAVAGAVKGCREDGSCGASSPNRRQYSASRRCGPWN